MMKCCCSHNYNFQLQLDLIRWRTIYYLYSLPEKIVPDETKLFIELSSFQYLIKAWDSHIYFFAVLIVYCIGFLQYVCRYTGKYFFNGSKNKHNPETAWPEKVVALLRVISTPYVGSIVRVYMAQWMGRNGSWPQPIGLIIEALLSLVMRNKSLILLI